MLDYDEDQRKMCELYKELRKHYEAGSTYNLDLEQMELVLSALELAAEL